MKRRAFLQSTACGLGYVSLGSYPRELPAIPEGPVLTVGDDHLVFDANRARYRVDSSGHRILALDDSGRIRSEFGGLGSGCGRLNYPRAAEIGPTGDLFVLDYGNRRILVLAADLDHVRSSIEVAPHPTDIALADDGSLWVTDSDLGLVQVLDPLDGPRRRVRSGRRLNGPNALTIDSRGSVHVVDAGNARVVVCPVTGEPRTYGRYGRERVCSEAPRPACRSASQRSTCSAIVLGAADRVLRAMPRYSSLSRASGIGVRPAKPPSGVWYQRTLSSSERQHSSTERPSISPGKSTRPCSKPQSL